LRAAQAAFGAGSPGSERASLLQTRRFAGLFRQPDGSWGIFAPEIRSTGSDPECVHDSRLEFQPEMLPATMSPKTMENRAKLSVMPTAAKHFPKISGFFEDARIPVAATLPW
jgi:hypothetical protein